MTAQFVLAYYLGAYGPTIRIDAQRWEYLAAVGRLFRRLASGETSEEDVGVALGCRLDSLHSLVAVREEGRNQKALTLYEVVAGLPAFRWSQDGDDWLEHAERIDVLLDSDSPGHQYLTNEGFDDALVEVCFRE
jgi:hypothetical protein